MKKEKTLLILLLAGLLLLPACNFPLAKQPVGDDVEESALQTAVAQTIAAQATPTLMVEELPTPQAGQPLQTPQSTPQSPSVPAAPTPTVLPCNRAVFVRETVPDDSEFDGNQRFTKSWTLKNEGTCTWTSSYKLVFENGDAMGAPASVSLTANVPPGQEVTIEVPMQTPAVPGTYTGFWRMQADDGEKFEQVFVRIQTRSPLFAVTGVRHNLQAVSPDSCPYTYPVEITIITNAAGEVTYLVSTSSGGESATRAVNFDEAGTKTVKYDWSGLGESGAATQYELRVYIDKPNNQWFGPYRLNVTCP